MKVLLANPAAVRDGLLPCLREDRRLWFSGRPADLELAKAFSGPARCAGPAWTAHWPVVSRTGSGAARFSSRARSSRGRLRAAARLVNPGEHHAPSHDREAGRRADQGNGRPRRRCPACPPGPHGPCSAPGQHGSGLPARDAPWPAAPAARARAGQPGWPAQPGRQRLGQQVPLRVFAIIAAPAVRSELPSSHRVYATATARSSRARQPAMIGRWLFRIQHRHTQDHDLRLEC